jgi:hypothetical protein
VSSTAVCTFQLKRPGASPATAVSHHIVHWADGGATSKENTCLLCSYHHTFVHEGGYQVQRSADGGFDFISPWGNRIDRAPPLWSTGDDGVQRLIEEQEALQITSETTARWNVDRFDIHWAVPTEIWRAALPSEKPRPT